MSAVKRGDRVRLTCGESVVTGTVTGVAYGGVEVMPDGFSSANYFLLAGWTVEVLPPPIPDTFGTVVLDRDNDAWQCSEDGWYLANDDSDPWSFDKLQKFAGPLTVLWTPGEKT